MTVISLFLLMRGTHKNVITFSVVKLQDSGSEKKTITSKTAGNTKFAILSSNMVEGR